MKTYVIHEFSSDISPAVWACVKRYRLLRLRGNYGFEYQIRLLRNGCRRRFYDENRNDCYGFAENFDAQGMLQSIDFFDEYGEVVARIEFGWNPAKNWHF